MIVVSVTEFRRHIGRYLDLCQKEDVFLTKRGEIVRVLVGYERRKKQEQSAL